MKSWSRFLLAGIAALALVAPLTVRAEDKEEKVEIKDLPKAVVDAVTAAQPGGTIKEADKVTKDGATVYEVDVAKDGKTFEVTVDASGKVVSNKEEKDEPDEKKK